METRYDLYYHPEFSLELAEYRHVDERSVRDFIAKIKESIRAEGMHNPLWITVYGNNERFVVHPGKCRANALRQLGHTTAPSIIYYPWGGRGVEGSELLPSDLGVVQSYFTGDCKVHMNKRFASVDKQGK